MGDITWDIESNGLLNNDSIDYCSSPYKLKDSFKIHCIVVEEHATGNIIAFYNGDTYILDGRKYEETIENQVYVLEEYNPVEYTHYQLSEFRDYIQKNPLSKVVAHNQINFDLLATKLYFDMDYSIEPDIWDGKKVIFEDTLVISKTLNPDRFGGHSLDSLSEKAGLRKVAFRKHMHVDIRFKHFAADMLYYNIYDSKANTKVYKYLMEEKGTWKWDDPIALEKSVIDIITRQEHRGFKFDKQLAYSNITELDMLMEERRVRVEPILPPRPATKKFMDDHTPPAKQFKQNGEMSANLIKFLEKNGGVILEDEMVEIFGNKYKLPLPNEPLVTTMKATIDDTTHIKNWLVGLGWNASEYKERDLSVNAKKQKLTGEKYEIAVRRYVEQTLESNFCNDRLEKLNTTKGKLLDKLLKANPEKSIKVLTNPSFTKGQDKEMCPDLERISEQFPYAKDVVEYLTYKHRRNSILGGGVDWDEDDEDEYQKGYLAAIRDDGRIPTPAGTCDAATSRFKHKLVANIPRVSSLYGKNMRALFGVDDGFFQIGYDFDSLEAREEAHYCWRYEDEPKEYCNSLLLDKPNDVHSVMARKISEIIKRKFERSPAKSVKYGCLPLRTKVLTKKGWQLFGDLREGDELISYNPESGFCEDDVILKTHYFEDKEVYRLSNKYDSFECTGDHRWYGWKRAWVGGKPKQKRFGFFNTEEIVQEHNILLTAKYIFNSGNILEEEAALVGWLLSDGYYKWSEREEKTSCSFGKRKGIKATIAQSKHKYWKELEDCLNKNSCQFNKYEKQVENGNTVFIYDIKSEWIRNFLDRVVGSREQKHDINWTKWVLTLDEKAMEAFYNAFYLADGETKNRDTCEVISQNRGNILDAIVAVKQLLGNGRISFNKKQETAKECIAIRTQRRKHITCQELKKEAIGIEPTFCLTTKNGTFIIWQDDFVGITGNCTYGAQEAKVAKTIGSDLATGKIVFDAFWQAADPLNKLKEKLKIYWETTGQKKFILGIDGRKVPTRSAHAILNSLFQSAGVVCAKRAMVIHDRKLKAWSLWVDFFKDDWKNKEFSQQLIAYHDEAQLEVSKQLVKFKMFATTEEAQAFKDVQDVVWSDIKESPKGGFFVAYCKAGELAVESVREAGQYYNLNVELTAGYILGRNWKECH